jgi:hypothetical protein
MYVCKYVHNYPSSAQMHGDISARLALARMVCMVCMVGMVGMDGMGRVGGNSRPNRILGFRFGSTPCCGVLLRLLLPCCPALSAAPFSFGYHAQFLPHLIPTDSSTNTDGTGVQRGTCPRYMPKVPTV